MPLVHYVKKARRDNSAVKRGEPYYWWKFGFSEKLYSKTAPKRSQLTQSDYKGCVYDLQDSISDYEIGDPDQFSDMIFELTEQIIDMRDQCKESLDNMKENLHVAPNGMLLKARIASCEFVLAELEELEWDEEAFEDADDTFDTSPVDAALKALDLDAEN